MPATGMGGGAVPFQLSCYLPVPDPQRRVGLPRPEGPGGTAGALCPGIWLGLGVITELTPQPLGPGPCGPCPARPPTLGTPHGERCPLLLV